LNESLLQMRNVAKRFHGTVALSGVDLDVRRGEVHVLLGENGAGKSTLMKILSGTYRADGGELIWNGAAVDVHDPTDSLGIGIGMVYQELTLVKELSVAENVFLGRLPKRNGFVDWRTAEERTERILELLGVRLDVRRNVSRYELGIQQLVEIARAISRDAKLIILDEPTSALTEQEVRSLFSAIRRLKAQGISFIYITHKLEEVFEIGDAVTVLRDGRSIATLRELSGVTQERLVGMMVGRPIGEQFPKAVHATERVVMRVNGLGDGRTIRDISFTLHEGEVLGIAGLVGSGISELVETLFGLRKPVEGAIEIRGEPYTPKHPRHAIERGLGLVTKDRKEGLLLHMSVAQNITVSNRTAFQRAGFLDRKKELETAEEYRRLLKINAPSVSAPIGALSGGNQQKGAIAKWLCNGTSIYIMDDPTRGIDIGAKLEVYKLLNRITEQGGSVILVSTELPELLGMSDRIAVMNRGRLVADFAASECSQELIMGKAAGGR